MVARVETMAYMCVYELLHTGRIIIQKKGIENQALIFAERRWLPADVSLLKTNGQIVNFLLRPIQPKRAHSADLQSQANWRQNRQELQ